MLVAFISRLSAFGFTKGQVHDISAAFRTVCLTVTIHNTLGDCQERDGMWYHYLFNNV